MLAHRLRHKPIIGSTSRILWGWGGGVKTCPVPRHLSQNVLLHNLLGISRGNLSSVFSDPPVLGPRDVGSSRKETLLVLLP